MITDIPAQAWVAVPGAAVVLGCIVVLKKYVFTNGKCPAEDVLQKQREYLIEATTVNKGLTEAIGRNTSALITHNEHLGQQNETLVRLTEVLGRRKSDA